MSAHTERDRLGVDPAPHAVPTPPSSFSVPAGAVDAHAHVIGTSYIEARSYTPTPAPESAYLQMLDATGIDHGVLVQVSVHGIDNSLMLRTLQTHRKRLRGIAVIRPDLFEAELRRLKDAGVVGLRLNTTTGGGVGVADLERYEALCVELGWHLQFLVEPGQLPPLANRMARMRVPVIFDHMGYVHAGPGMAQAAATLIAMVRDGAWVKLSGGFRLSRVGPPYDDTMAFARALAEAGPDRCVWGSDWPHVSFRGTMPNPGDLLDLLAASLPDRRALEAVLVHNPHRLYGFGD